MGDSGDWFVATVVIWLAVDLGAAVIFKRCVFWPKCPVCRDGGHHDG